MPFAWRERLALAAVVLLLTAVLSTVGYLRSRPDDAPSPGEQFALAPAQVPDPPAAATRSPVVPVGDRVVVPSLGVAAPLDLAGVSEGSLELPEDLERLVLWDGSASAASARGSLLVAGHVDGPGQEPGALHELSAISPGAAIDVVRDERVTRWKVVGLAAVPKTRLPTEVWGGPRGPRRLYLVTCGGPVVSGHYRDNVVVTAVPVRGP